MQKKSIMAILCLILSLNSIYLQHSSNSVSGKMASHNYVCGYIRCPDYPIGGAMFEGCNGESFLTYMECGRYVRITDPSFNPGGGIILGSSSVEIIGSCSECDETPPEDPCEQISCSSEKCEGCDLYEYVRCENGECIYELDERDSPKCGCQPDPCQKDSDSDGVNDCNDNCPNERGSSSNNGCPEPQKTEICKNGIDDDNDGAVDCWDTDCSATKECCYTIIVKGEIITQPELEYNNYNFELRVEEVIEKPAGFYCLDVGSEVDVSLNRNIPNSETIRMGDHVEIKGELNGDNCLIGYKDKIHVDDTECPHYIKILEETECGNSPPSIDFKYKNWCDIVFVHDFEVEYTGKIDYLSRNLNKWNPGCLPLFNKGVPSIIMTSEENSIITYNIRLNYINEVTLNPESIIFFIYYDGEELNYLSFKTNRYYRFEDMIISEESIEKKKLLAFEFNFENFSVGDSIDLCIKFERKRDNDELDTISELDLLTQSYDTDSSYRKMSEICGDFFLLPKGKHLKDLKYDNFGNFILNQLIRKAIKKIYGQGFAAFLTFFNWLGDIFYKAQSFDLPVVYVIYPQTGKISNYSYVSLNSPAILHAYDSQGNHVGVESDGALDLEIPNAYYSGPDAHPQTIIILDTKKNYRFVVEGKESGQIDLTIEQKTGERKSIKEYPTSMQVNSKAEVEILGTSISDMKLDSDGDGIYEKTIKPKIIQEGNNIYSNPILLFIALMIVLSLITLYIHRSNDYYGLSINVKNSLKNMKKDVIRGKLSKSDYVEKKEKLLKTAIIKGRLTKEEYYEMKR